MDDLTVSLLKGKKTSMPELQRVAALVLSHFLFLSIILSQKSQNHFSNL
jgi:hypothetical protein